MLYMPINAVLPLDLLIVETIDAETVILCVSDNIYLLFTMYQVTLAPFCHFEGCISDNIYLLLTMYQVTLAHILSF